MVVTHTVYEACLLSWRVLWAATWLQHLGAAVFLAVAAGAMGLGERPQGAHLRLRHEHGDMFLFG